MGITKEHITSTTDLEATGAALPLVLEVGTKQQISSELSLALHKLHKNPDHADVIKKEIINTAKELAAVVLPEEKCHEIGIMPAIADNQSFYHPPLRGDVINIAYAMEATQDQQLEMALVDAIEELPDELRAHCSEALVQSLTEDIPFEQALIELEAKARHDFTVVTVGARAVAYMDRVSLDMPADETIDLNSLPADDEHLERLVQPLATGYLNGKAGDAAYTPHIIFGHPHRDDGARSPSGNSL